MRAQYLWKEDLNVLILAGPEDKDLLDFQSSLLKV